MSSFRMDVRHPFTPRVITTEVVPMVLVHYLLAILVTLPHTRIYRLALLPLEVALTLNGLMHWDFANGDEEANFVNVISVFGMFLVFFAGLDWGWRKDAYKRLDGPQETMKDALINGLDLCTNPTALGWSHGLNPESKPLSSNSSSKSKLEEVKTHKEVSRVRFVVKHVGWTLAWLLIIDLVKFTVDTIEPRLKTSSSSIFDPSLPPTQRYLKSTLLTALFGILTVGGLELLINLTKIISVAILSVSPIRCPQLFDKPWFSTSLRRLWNRGWHQHARYYFVMFGGKPVARLVGTKGRAGRAGLVLGTFILSGIVHDLATMSLGLGADPFKVTTFFTMMGLGIVLEEAFTSFLLPYTTFGGRRVKGLLGWVWTMGWLLGWGGLLVDAWCLRGMGANRDAFPEDRRPSKILWEFLIPLLLAKPE